MALISGSYALLAGDHRFILLLGQGEIQRRPDGWRFGTRRIADHVVDRLIAAGAAVMDGDRVRGIGARKAGIT
jgi:hypothetical protein